MLSVKRLNLDSSWSINFNSVNFIVDPWLVGSEIDGFKWLNEAWHIKDPVKIEDLPEFKFLMISQNYEDHCHIATVLKKTIDAFSNDFMTVIYFFIHLIADSTLISKSFL